MPTVPRYEPRAQIQGAPNARVNTQAPAEAFGGGQGAAAEGLARVSNSLGGAASQFHEYVQEERKKADQVQLTGADSSTLELQTQLQIEADNMRLGDAFKAPDYVKEKWTAGAAKIREGLGTEEQKQRFDVMQAGRYASLNQHVSLHAASQARDLDEVNTKSWFINSRNSARLNSLDDGAVASTIAQQETFFDEYAARTGLPKDSPAYIAEKQKELSATHATVIDGRLDSGFAGGFKAAESYFKANQANMTERDRTQAMAQIDRVDSIETGKVVFGATEGFKLADGQYDEAKMRAYVDALPDKTTEKKDKIWAHVKSLAGEATMNRNREDNANYRNFMNTVIQARRQGDSLESALTIAKQNSKDATDQANKEDAIRKIYSPPTASDPQAYIDLWQRTQSGKINPNDIDNAFLKDNRISANDWKSLKEDYYKVVIEGKSIDVKSAWDRIDILAKENIGSKDAQNEFIYDLKVSGRGMSADELWKLANDKLKGAAGTGWFGSNFNAQPQYKIDTQKRDAQNLGWGKAETELGKDTVMAIGKGTLYQGKETWSLQDLEGFSQALGGYDKILPGTPGRNAMQSLMKRNQLVTPANVNAVLSKHKDGIY